jgi:hypothetical protein
VGLIELVVILLVVGIILWAVQTIASPYVDPAVLRIIRVVIIVFLLIWLLQAFGLFTSFRDIRIR